MPRDSNLAETVDLLDSVAGRETSNQRALARKIGISVGLVNALLHRAVRKGLIKILEAPARRYAYYLTPQGLAEKSRLVAEYLDFSLSFFRQARQEYADVFARHAHDGQPVVLCGAGELAEIANLAAGGTGVTISAVFDQTSNQPRAAGLPVIREAGEIAPDAVLVVTDGREPQQTFDRLSAVFDCGRIVAPSFLRLFRT
jgi:DNA-binding MarR family transcriptional regulator